MKNKWILGAVCVAVLSSCSPMRSSAHDERHLWELTLHEVQTNLDDLRHDIRCFQAELQILDGRIKHSENALASLKQEQAGLEKLGDQFAAFEKRYSGLEKNQKTEEVQKLLAHANETSIALTQFKDRIQELESELLSRPRKGQETSQKTYKVRSGDSLEKIARSRNTSVEKIKRLNRLENDRIIPGQELALPNE